MKYYIDIIFLPNADINLGFIWQKVFQQIHIALVDNKVGDNESAIALSIVDYGDKEFPLGNKLRLLANDEDTLTKLDIHLWLKRLNDYCQIGDIKKVPNNIKGYAVFRRKAVKSIQNKAKRRANHLNKPYAEVLDYLIKEGRSFNSKLPFIRAESQNTKKLVGEGVSYEFLLFIERNLFEKPSSGKFDCYGLSKTATVPLF